MKKKWRDLLVYVVISVVLYIGLRYLFWMFFPFLIAFILMELFHPIAKWVRKWLKISKGISVLVLFFGIIAAIGGVFWWLLHVLFEQLAGIFQNVELYEEKMQGFVQQCCLQIERMFGLRFEYVQPYLLSRIYQTLAKMGDNISSGIMSYSYAYAKGAVKIIGVLVIIIVTTILMTKDYEKLLEMLKKNAFYSNIKRIKEKVFYAGGSYLRAQCILVLIVSSLSTLIFWFLRQPNALLLGTVIGLLDAMPFFGTGSVLIPWSVVKIFQGDFFKAAMYISLYLISSFIRELLEPKLIGNRLGVPPVFIIGTIYMGIVLYGIPGVVLGPMQALMTMEIGKQWIEDHP